MKQGLKRYMEVELQGMDKYWANVDHIDIVFQQQRSSGVRKTVRWSPSDESQCRRGEGNTLLVPWTREETYQYRAGFTLYLDVRPVLTSGQDLRVDPVALRMDWTLFKEDET